MFSLHETKPLGRGEGGILVVPKVYAAKLRGILSFGQPVRKTTNGKMSEIQAHAILEWWRIWDIYVQCAFLERSKALGALVEKSKNATWGFTEEMKDPSVIAANVFLVINMDYDLEKLQKKSRITLRRYYVPIDENHPHTYNRSLVLAVLPFIPMKEYTKLFNSIDDLQSPCELLSPF